LYSDIGSNFKAFIGLAPVAEVGHQESALVTCLDLLDIADLLYHHFPHFLYIPTIAPKFEPILHLLPRFVWNIVEALVGYDATYHVDLSFLPMMARNDVGGTSTKNMMHWIQLIRSGKFQFFDYGKD